MSKVLCIYHGNCADGFTSAWAARRALGDGVEFHAGVYQDAPPICDGRDVLLVDFSYKRAILEEMREHASSVTILDHHKTAEADLRDLAGVEAVFDMNRSGARITWDYFFPGQSPPPVLLHVEDRDLWRFALEKTREIQANIFSYPYDFEVWDRLMFERPEVLAAEGAAIERKHFKDIAELTKVVTRPMKIAGQVVPMANLPYTLTSDAGHLLCGDEYPFAGCYWDTPEGRVFSLRSRNNGADVGEIAKLYGGGGHAHASGFRVSFDKLAQFDPV